MRKKKNDFTNFWEELRGHDNKQCEKGGAWIPIYSLEIKGLYVHLYNVKNAWLARFSQFANGGCSGKELYRNGIPFEDFCLVVAATTFLSLTKPFLADALELVPIPSVDTLKAAIEQSFEDDNKGLLRLLKSQRRVAKDEQKRNLKCAGHNNRERGPRKGR